MGDHGRDAGPGDGLVTSEMFREAAISMGIPADVFDRARELSRSGMDPITAMEQATREAEGRRVTTANIPERQTEG